MKKLAVLETLMKISYGNENIDKILQKKNYKKHEK